MGDFKQGCNFYSLKITRCTWPRHDYCLSRNFSDDTHAMFSQQQGEASKECQHILNVHLFDLSVDCRKCPHFYILNTTLLYFQVPFTKDCGSDDVCTSDLMLSAQSNIKASM